MRNPLYQRRTFLSPESNHQLIEPGHQILGPKMRIASQHLHGLMTGDCRYLLITEPGLDQTRDRLVAQIMETKVI
jgi:hypothetical protein